MTSAFTCGKEVCSGRLRAFHLLQANGWQVSGTAKPMTSHIGGTNPGWKLLVGGFLICHYPDSKPSAPEVCFDLLVNSFWIFSSPTSGVPGCSLRKEAVGVWPVHWPYSSLPQFGFVRVTKMLAPGNGGKHNFWLKPSLEFSPQINARFPGRLSVRGSGLPYPRNVVRSNRLTCNIYANIKWRTLRPIFR